MASAAKELRYRGQGGAVYGNLAYDLDRDVLERELRHAGEARRETAKPAPQVRSVSKAQVRERQSLSLLTAAGFLAVAAAAVLLLLSYVQLTTISTAVVELKGQLSALETQNVTLTAQYQQMYDLNTVKEAARAAGMAKPGASQVFYVDLSDGDCAVVYQQAEPGVLSRLLTSLNHGVYAVVEYFD